MSSDPGRPILILGMHRSGTSYLARLMQALGVFIGDDLVGPRKGNPRGHFEAAPVLDFHLRLIAARLSPGRRAFDDGMLVQEPMDTSFSEAERSESESLLDDLRRDGPWGWKEPRTCLFLPLWQELIPQAGAVVVYRHPLEVHQSLLRREHWDLALFPDQAYRAYWLYNQPLLEADFSPAFTFNANAGFADPTGLASQLAQAFDLKKAAVPEFHAAEFRSLGVSKALHALFSLIQPEAAAVFDQLQEKADLPYAWAEREDDPELEQLAAQLQPLLQDLSPPGRASLVPLLDWWSSGRSDEVFTLYQKLGEEIGGRVQRVEQWNREAAEIFKENERLAADYERMGKEFATQQEFLAKQAKTQAKIWEELSRTGKSWEEQRDLINELLAEKRGLLEEVQRLRAQLEAGKEATE